MFSLSEMFEVRDARIEDAGEVAGVLVRSITQLCQEDHHDNLETITRWTLNKTPEIVVRWIANPDVLMLVAVETDRVAAVGGAIRPDHIVLNYVDPSCRLRGASTLLMAELERGLSQAGANILHLESTRTARSFYRSRGWQEVGETVDKFGMPGFRMVKPATPA